MTTLPSWDAHYEDMVANQGAVVIEQSGNEIVIAGDLANLLSWESSNPAQGTHKWIALDIATNLPSIVGATWDGSELAQSDEDEATDLGLPKGHIVFWAKADVLVDEARTITIGMEGKEDCVITVSFEDTGL